MIAESRRNAFWFGTEEKMGWFPTPNRGAQTGGSGWAAEGTTLNGGGFQLNSFGSHRQYVFEWPNTSSAKMAQTMKSYADGSFGRGLIYFLDPLIYTTNVLPAMWADPSMGIGQEGASLVYGVEASGLPTSDNPNDLPVKSAYYDLGSIADGWRGKEDAVFIPVPEGYTLSLGSIHSQTGQGRVLYRTQSRTGALGAVTAVTPLLENTSQLVNTFISGPDLAGVWLFVGKIGAGAGSVTLTAMTGRLLPTVKSIVAPVATNLFTNPRLVGDGTWAEVRRNLVTNPAVVGVTGYGTNRCTITDSGGELIGTVSEVGYFPRVGLSGAMPVVAGDVVGVSADIGSGLPLRARVAWFSNAAGTVQIGAISKGPLSSGGRLAYSETAPAGALSFRAEIGVADSSPVGATFRFSKPALVVNDTYPFAPLVVGQPVSGVTQPEDFRVRWLGTPNASESVMEIENVAGFTSGGSIAGVSKRDGKPAVRQIVTPGSAVTSPNVRLTQEIPASARAQGTFIATRHQDKVLSGTDANSVYNLRVDSPIHIAPRTNQVGPVENRLSFSGLTGAYYTYLGMGFTAPSVDGDVWWTDIGLFAGVYDGPAFNGSSGTIMIGSQLATTEWDGTPDNSTSTAYSTSTELINIRKGPWIGGQGHSGCRFIGKPTEIKYGPFNGGQVGFAASFREVGSWLYG